MFVFLAGQQAFGQITTSDIVGTVSDATGAFVMNAKVAVTITATGDTRKQLSGSDGRFVFNSLLLEPLSRDRRSAELQQNAVKRDRRSGRPGPGGCAAALLPGGP